MIRVRATNTRRPVLFSVRKAVSSFTLRLSRGESLSFADGRSILRGFQGLMIKIYVLKMCESLDYIVRIS